MPLQPNFEVYTLPNGFRVALKRTDTDRVFGILRINHGALHERPGEEGTAHFLEHMLVNGGTKKYSPEQQESIIEEWGHSNAHTNRKKTWISAGMFPQDISSFLEMTAQEAFSPRLEPKIIDQQKEIILREIARKVGKSSYEDEKRFFDELSRSPLHTYEVLGTEEVIRTMAQEKLSSFHARGYAPNNMILMLSGPLPGDILDQIKRYFETKAPQETTRISFPHVTSLERQVLLHTLAPDLKNKKNASNSNADIMLGFPMPEEEHPDYPAARIMNYILGMGKLSRLFKRIRNDQGLAYAIGSTIQGSDNFGHIVIRGGLNQQRWNSGIQTIFEEIDKLKSEHPTPEKIMAGIKKMVYSRPELRQNNFDSLLQFDPVNVTIVAQMNYFFDEKPSMDQIKEALERVTPSDVQRVAQIYLPNSQTEGKYVLLVRDPFKVIS